MPHSRSSGYSELLKTNPAFRNLWYGQVVSELGDWLNSIAIYALILELQGSGMALALAMMAKLLPMVVVSPLAGVMVDRMDRRRVMIVTDILRCFAVLGLLAVNAVGDLWLLYALVVVEIALSGFFEPARSAIIPSIVRREELVAANGLSGVTWSVMVALGAGLSGVLVAALGIRAAFILDAVSYLASAWFISRIPALGGKPARTPAEPPAARGDFFQGMAYIFSRPVVLALSLVKSGMAFVGGVMTLIPLYAHEMFTDPAGVSLATGALYSARGIGAGFGPWLVNRWFGNAPPVLRRAIGASFFLGGSSLLLFSQSRTPVTAAISLACLACFGSIIWVFSTALIHLEAEERYLGRIFSLELALLTLVMGLSNWGVGYITDTMGGTPHTAAAWLGALYIVPGFLWLGFLATSPRWTATTQKPATAERIASPVSSIPEESVREQINP